MYLSGSDLSGNFAAKAMKLAKKAKQQKKKKAKRLATYKPPITRPRPVITPVLRVGGSTDPSTPSPVAPTGSDGVATTGGGAPVMSFTDSSGAQVDVSEGEPEASAMESGFRPSPVILGLLAVGVYFMFFRKGR